jgi:RND family efflux transporter MFP subunit
MNALLSPILRLIAPMVLMIGPWGVGLGYASGPTLPESGIALHVDRLSRVAQMPEYDAFAEVVSLNSARLAVEGSGVVREWYADVGSRVQKDERLLSLDDRDAQLDLAQAKAQVDAAQARLALAVAQLQRAEGLVSQGFLSQEALLQRRTETALSQAELASARAKQNLAERSLEKTTLRAPFSGIVLERLVQKGETLATGAVAFVLSDPVRVEVEVRLSADQVESLRRARSIVFRGPSAESAVRVLRISDVAQMPSRTQTVRLGFVSVGQRPLSGVTGQVVWRGGALVIPSGLLVRRNSGLGVFVLMQSVQPQTYTVRFVPLRLAQEGRPARLESDSRLQDDALVVVRGQDSLQDGQQVKAARVRVEP